MSEICLKHPFAPGRVICKDGSEMSEVQAKRSGLVIHRADNAAAAIAMGYSGDAAAIFASEYERASALVSQASNDYCAAVLALPEAKDRPIAARKLASAYDARSMPLAKAQSFLRGLPSERADVKGQIPAASPLSLKNNDTMLRRKVEIAVAASAHNTKYQGEAGSKRRFALNYALTLNKSGMGMSDALSRVGLNISEF